MKTNLFTWLIAAILIVFLGLKHCESERNFNRAVRAEDSLRRQGNKVYTQIITDPAIAKQIAGLKEYIDKKTLSATSITTRTIIDTTGKPIIIDTEPVIVELPSGEKHYYHYPRYTKEFDNLWYKATVSADSQSVRLKLLTRDSLTLRHQWKSTGFLGLGKPRLDVEVFNHNPYSTTVGLKSFQAIPKPKRFSVGFGVYYGINQEIKPSLFIGGGLQYTLFRF